MDVKTIIAIVGDLHIGGNTALATPEFEIHIRNSRETQLVKANRMQEWLWECWTEYWDYVYQLAGDKKREHRLVIVFVGDILEGIHHDSPQLMQEPGDQFSLAMDILLPHIEKADATYGVLGTATHGGRANTNEAELYRALGMTGFGYRISLEVDGLVHDFAHHGRAGRRPWTSAAAGYATEVLVDYTLMRKPLPNYIWRGHNHIIDDSGLKFPNTRAICTPSWQLKTDYGNRISSGTMRSDIGGFIMDGRKLDDSRARYFGQTDEVEIIKV